MERWLESHGRLEAEVEAVDFNLFSGNMVVHSLLAERDGEGGFQWARAALEISFRPLLKKRIVFDDISFTKARFSIVKEENGDVYVAGFRVPAAAKPDEHQKEAAQDGGWEIGFGDIDLKQVRVRYRTPQIEREILIRRAHIGAMHSWNPSASGNFSAEMALDEGALHIAGTAKPYGPQATIQGRVEAKQLPLAFVSPWLQQLDVGNIAGTLSADAEISAVLGDQTSAKFEGTLSLAQIAGDTAQVAIDLLSATWEGSAQMTLPAKGGAARITISGALSAENPDVISTDRQLSARAHGLRIQGDLRLNTADIPPETAFVFEGGLTAENVRVARDRSVLANLQKLSANRLHVNGTDRIAAETAKILQARLLEKPANPEIEEAMPYALAWDALALSDLDVDIGAKRLRIGATALRGAQANLVRNQQGQFTSFERLLADGGSSAAQSSAEPAWNYSIREMRIDSDSSLRFVDRSVVPDVDLRFSNIEAHIGRLNSSSPDPVPIDLQSDVGDYASIQAKGTIVPLADKISMDINGEVKQFSLPEVRGYARQKIGYNIKSGQLYADFHLLVERARMDSEIKLFIQKLNLSRLSEQDTGPVEAQLGLPLNAALDLLRDRSGNIRLQLPVTGTLTDLDIGLQSVIAKALRSATFEALKTAALTYFAPLGAAYTAGKLLGKAVALRLNPINFNAAQAQLDPNDRRYLDQVAEKLKDRPEAQLLICGKATYEDRLALAEKSTHDSDSRKNNTAPAVPDGRLLDLARNRAENTRDYLIQSGIGSKRLLICAPEIKASKKAQPQVELAV
jgi:hypothetical protein